MRGLWRGGTCTPRPGLGAPCHRTGCRRRRGSQCRHRVAAGRRALRRRRVSVPGSRQTWLARVMTEVARRTARRSAMAAYIGAGAAVVGLVTIALFFWIGQPWGTLNDVAVLVMTAAIAPLMLAFWELGGWTPTPL